MRRTISNNQLLTLFLTFAGPMITAGCASVPAPETPAQSQAAMPEPKKATSPAAVNVGSTPNATASTPVVVYTEGGVLPVPAESPIATAQAASADPDDQPATALPDDDLWARIRAGLKMPKLDPSVTRPHENWFIENAEFREAMFERSKLYLYYIVEEVDKRGMPMEIALLPAIESAYKPYAYSRAKASGLWQFIPSTGRLYGLKTNWWYDGRRDIIASTRAALDYLQKLYGDFGDWHLALAAYNAGEGRVGRAMEANRRKGKPTDYLSLKQLKPETRHYVPKLLAVVNMVTDPQRFGIQLPSIPNEPYFTTVETDSQVDLGVIARLTGMEVDHLHFINPGYTRWATDPNGPHHILVPADKKDMVVAGLNNLADHERVQWRHHEVRKGDTLYGIARRYGVTVEAIKSSNKLAHGLRIGQSLMLPVSATAKLPQPPTAVTKAAAKPVHIAGKGGNPIIHRVRPGDTLTSIARRYNVMIHQLAEWNTIRPDDILPLGRKLKIWTNDGPQADSRLTTPLTYG